MDPYPSWEREDANRGGRLSPSSPTHSSRRRGSTLRQTRHIPIRLPRPKYPQGCLFILPSRRKKWFSKIPLCEAISISKGRRSGPNKISSGKFAKLRVVVANDFPLAGRVALGPDAKIRRHKQRGGKYIPGFSTSSILLLGALRGPVLFGQPV